MQVASGEEGEQRGAPAQDSVDGIDGESASPAKPKEMIFEPDQKVPGFFNCKLCSKSVRSRWHHIQTHFSRNHKCPYCGNVYSRIDTLKKHARKTHNRDISTYIKEDLIPSLFSHGFPAFLAGHHNT